MSNEIIAKDMFDKAVIDELSDRINQLHTGTSASWGKMNAPQMLAHLNEAFKSSMANQPLKRIFIGRIIGKMAKRSFTGTKPFKQGLPTDKSFIMTGEKNFDREKENLLRLMRNFSEGGPTVLTKHKHPFFGSMTVDDWNKLMYRHTDHHLRQFGV